MKAALSLVVLLAVSPALAEPWPAGKLVEGNHTGWPTAASVAAARRSAEAIELSCRILAPRARDLRYEAARAYAQLCTNQKGRPVSEPPLSSP